MTLALWGLRCLPLKDLLNELLSRFSAIKTNNSCLNIYNGVELLVLE